ARLVTSEKVSRHEVAFEQSLEGAEAGLDLMAAQVRANPLATSFANIDSSVAATGAVYHVTATGSNGSWTITSRGTQTYARKTVTRTLTETVSVGKLLNYPLFADTNLTLGGASGKSGVDNYDSKVSSDVCTTGGTQTTMLQLLGTPDLRMCHQTSPTLGAVATNGTFSAVGTDINNVSEADIYNAASAGSNDPDATGKCVGDTTTCNSSNVVTRADKLSYPLANVCQNGIGAGATAYDGSFALAANAVYNFTNVTLNATAIANLGNLSGSQIVICFSGDLDLVPAVPINSTVTSVLPPIVDPRPPATLLLISTSGACPTGSPVYVCISNGTGPRVNFGLDPALGSTLSALPTSLSAVVYAPNAQCTASGHVDVYGAVVCGSLTAPSGFDVHYDTELGSTPFTQPVTVSNWREITN
ncbi:MAG TPA: hypothetical protein VHE83_18835, partial [Mycobacteriales bacterium]|nr:hypothetical protein [Mycobacteriales bacterium]